MTWMTAIVRNRSLDLVRRTRELPDVDDSLAAQLVDESAAPGSWILADRSGNKVCIAAWPDGAPMPESDETA